MSSKVKIYNLDFIAEPDTRNRVTIPKNIADVIGLKKHLKIHVIIRAVYVTGGEVG